MDAEAAALLRHMIFQREFAAASSRYQQLAATHTPEQVAVIAADDDHRASAEEAKLGWMHVRVWHGPTLDGEDDPPETTVESLAVAALRQTVEGLAEGLIGRLVTTSVDVELTVRAEHGLRIAAQIAQAARDIDPTGIWTVLVDGVALPHSGT